MGLRPWGYTLLVLGCLLHAFLGAWAIGAQSPTFDEPLHLTAGKVYLTQGDYRLNGVHHPPLASLWCALALGDDQYALPKNHPLLRGGDWRRPRDQYDMALDYLYAEGSAEKADQRLARGRFMMLAVALVFLIVLYFVVCHWFGSMAGFFTFFIAVLSPTFLAHGTLVTTDFLFMIFYFLSAVFLEEWSRKDKVVSALVAGLCVGLAFCSKYSAVSILPLIVIVGMKSRWYGRRSLVQWMGFMGAGFFIILIIHRVHEFPVFWEGLLYTVQRVQAGRSSFFLGQHGSQGWWYYFPVVFLMKTPLVLLLLLVLSCQKRLFRVFKGHYLLFWAPFLYSVLVCASTVQIGHRYILPLYPFLFTFVGAAMASWYNTGWTARFKTGRKGEGGGSRVGRGFVLGMAGLWLVCGTLMTGPFFLSYFNEAVGGPSKGFRYLSDSNVDWGQGLKSLQNFLKSEGVDQILLSYFGTGDPRAYGIRYASVGPYNVVQLPEEPVDLAQEPRQFFVISATNYQHTYYGEKDLFNWLHQRTPLVILARSLLVFDISKDRESLFRLSGILKRVRNDVVSENLRRLMTDLPDPAS